MHSHSGSDSLDQMCVVLARCVGGQGFEPVVGATGIEGLADLQVSQDEVGPAALAGVGAMAMDTASA
ncbi:hypothetical protein ACWDAO_33385 [Streptomyces sp. NPDC001212]